MNLKINIRGLGRVLQRFCKISQSEGVSASQMHQSNFIASNVLVPTYLRGFTKRIFEMFKCFRCKTRKNKVSSSYTYLHKAHNSIYTLSVLV